MLINIETVKEFARDIKEIKAIGGGLANDVWPQIKADILNATITCFDCKEVGAAGTAAVAGKAIGVYKDLKETTAKMVPIRKQFVPNKDNVVLYRKLYQQ